MMKHRIPAVVCVPFGCALLCAVTVVVSSGCSVGGRGAANSKAVNSYVQGVEQYQHGDSTAAIQSLENATKREPDLIMAQSMLGDLYRARGNYAAAAERYERMTKLDSYTASNHYRLGIAYHMLNRLQDAVAAYLRALNLNPKDARSCTNLGLAYLTLGQLDDALRYTQRATILDPKSAAVWLNLGVALEASGDFPQAESAYRRSLDVDPTNLQTMLNLGLNLVQQGKSEDAVSIMERVLQETDTPAIRKRYADALARGGRYDDAVAQYEKALANDEDNYEAMNGIAYVRIAEYRKGLELDDSKRDAAITMWKKSLAINSDQPRVETAVKDWSEQQTNLFAPEK